MSKKVLVVDDDKDLAGFLVLRCRDWGLEVKAEYDAMSALATILSWRPDLVCLDVTLAAGNGISVCEMLASDEQFAKIPVIMLTGRTDPDVIRKCHALCAYYVTKCDDVWPRIEPLLVQLLDLSPPASPQPPGEPPVQSAVRRSPAGPGTNGRLVDAIFELLTHGPTLPPGSVKASREHNATRPAEDSPPWVLHIDDDQELSHGLKLRLEQHGVAVIRAFDGMQGYRAAFTDPADAVILDYNMPNGQGDYILRRLKDNPVTRGIPVIVLTGDTSRPLERKMLNLGAEAVLHKPFEFRRLLSELRKFIDVVPACASQLA